MYSYRKAVIIMKRLETEGSRQFSYNSSTEVLEKYYTGQLDLVKKGNTDLATLELVMLGNTLDFISFIKKALGITLDTKEKSVEVFEEVMDALSRGIINVNLFDKDINIPRKAGAYLGALIIANVGGEWVDTSNGPAVVIDKREVYVLDFADKRLLSGSELNSAEYYKAVRTLKKL